jgi:hypothetical protein
MNIKKIICKITLTACLCSAATVTTHAQQRISTAEQRKIIDAALSTVESYEAFATVRDEAIKHNFLELFKNEEVQVYNDLLGVSDAGSMSVARYVERMATLKNKRVSIKNVNKESDPQLGDDQEWHISYSLDKSLNYVNACGIYFNSNTFYGHDYHLTLQMVYDSQKNRCLIESIKGTQENRSYFVITKDDARNERLTYGDQSITFNSYDQAVMKGVMRPALFGYQGNLKPMASLIGDCNIAQISYKAGGGHGRNTSDNRFLAKAHVDFGGGISVDTESGKGVSDDGSSGGLSFGADVGYTLYNSDKFRASILAGVGMSSSTVKLAYGSNNSDASFNSTADVDGDSYTRIYRGLQLSQEVSLSELNIPIYFDAEMVLTDMFSIYANLGIRMSMLSVGSAKASGTCSEIYGNYNSNYTGLELHNGNTDFPNWPFNGFATGSIQFADNDTKPELKSSSAFDILAGAGLRLNIPNSPVAVDLGVNYVMGGKAEFKSEEGGSKGVVTATLDESGKRSTEHINLFDGVTGVKRGGLQVKVGLVLKF